MSYYLHRRVPRGATPGALLDTAGPCPLLFWSLAQRTKSSRKQAPRQRDHQRQPDQMSRPRDCRVRAGSQARALEDGLEGDLRRVLAVALVDLGHFRGFSKGDVDTLRQSQHKKPPSSRPRSSRTYAVQCRTVLCQHNHLDRRVVSYVGLVGCRQRHLGEADTQTRVRVVGGPLDGDGGHHDFGHVGGDGAVAHVDVEGGEKVALEPARLEGNGATLKGPVCAVRGGCHAAACEEDGSVGRRKLRTTRGLHGYSHCMP